MFQDLQRVTGEKLELANHVSSLEVELERARREVVQGREELERIQQEKWELAAVNGDLQQRLQQTVALAHMQVRGWLYRCHIEVRRGRRGQGGHKRSNRCKDGHIEGRRVSN